MHTTLGIISDTHGLLRPEAADALRGCDLILHAGDIGDPAVIERLHAIAPVHAVRGNVDRGAWSKHYPETDAVACDARYFYLLHNLHDLDLDPVAAGFAAVISGHTHQPKIVTKNGVLYLNPGSAGPRRFSLPVSLAKMFLSENGLRAEIIALDV